MKRKIIKGLLGILLLACWLAGLVFIGFEKTIDIPWWGWILVLISIGISLAGWIHILRDFKGIE